MRHISRRMLPALLIVFAFSAITASGALAASKKGELVNEKGVALVKSKFTGTSTEKILFKSANGDVWQCRTAGALSGAMSSTKAGTAQLTLTGCEYADMGCKTKGAKFEEVILSLNLSVVSEKRETKEYDYLNGEVPEVELSCGGVPLKIRGAFRLDTPEEALSTKQTLVSNGESPASDPLQMSIDEDPFEGLRYADTLAVTFEEKAEFV